jgi:hypothetical protein
VTCRRIASLTALIAALPLLALGTFLLAEAGLILALANSELAADFAAARWLFVIAVTICLGGSWYLVGSGAYRAVRSWSSLVRFARQSFTIFGVSVLALLTGIVLLFVAIALGGGIF